MKYCPSCAQPVEHRLPDGDHLPRYVCSACGEIHYLNPKIIAGCVPEHGGQILLCRRAIEPRRGYWTIPAGFMENGETIQDAARRESSEEALAHVEVGSLLAVVSVLHADQVHVMFRAQLPEASYGVGVESLEVMLCDEADVPWDEIAFRSVDFALRRYFEDRQLGLERHHFHTLDYRKTGAA